uniref:Peptidase S1 domain-containing protein n=1 Tax=Anopheles maculatus TaxID=74869 RepID=A0A182SPM0_9DIPT
MCSPFRITVFLGFVLCVISLTSAQDYRVICGKRKVKSVYLIQNGLNAKPGHWPWHAAIYYKNDSDGVDYKCGGSIIDENTILTAASCVFKTDAINETDISIYVGRMHLTEDTEYTQKYDAKEIILHPNYSGSTNDNDIALIKLTANITMTKFVQPVCLWTMDANPYSIVGMHGTIVGFGSENHLKQTNLGVVDTLACINSDREVFGKLRMSEMLCVGGQEGTGACNGDSGGGLFFEVEGKWFVRGIVSYIPGQAENEICTTSKHAAFTDVTKYVDWIKGFINPEILPVSSDAIDVDYVEKLELFDLSTCGVASNSIASGGAQWTLPWVGFVGIYRSLDDTIDKRCVVTLLNEWYAVGPAHCFENDGLDINNTADNIALIELLNPADTSQPNVRPICIPIVPKLRTNTTTDLTIASQTSLPKSFISKPVNYIDAEVCTNKYAEQGFPLFLASKRLCTQIPSRAAQDCIQLKTGAPLQQLRRINGRRQYFLRGFDIFGRSCSTSLPSVYSNVNTFLDWILYNMKPNVVEKTEDTPNSEDAAIEDSWNQLHQEPDQKKLSLFKLDTCGVTTTNVDTVDDRIYYPWMGLLVTHKNTMEPLTYIESTVVLISDRYALAPAHIVSNTMSWWV